MRTRSASVRKHRRLRQRKEDLREWDGPILTAAGCSNSSVVRSEDLNQYHVGIFVAFWSSIIRQNSIIWIHQQKWTKLGLRLTITVVPSKKLSSLHTKNKPLICDECFRPLRSIYNVVYNNFSLFISYKLDYKRYMLVLFGRSPLSFFMCESSGHMIIIINKTVRMISKPVDSVWWIDEYFVTQLSSELIWIYLTMIFMYSVHIRKSRLGFLTIEKKCSILLVCSWAIYYCAEKNLSVYSFEINFRWSFIIIGSELLTINLWHSYFYLYIIVSCRYSIVPMCNFIL